MAYREISRSEAQELTNGNAPHPRFWDQWSLIIAIVALVLFATVSSAMKG